MKKILILLSLLTVLGAKSQCSANFSATVNSNGSVSFLSLCTGTSSTSGYMWNFGDSQSAYTSNPTHVYGSNGVYTVTLLLSDTSTSCNASATQTLSITNVSCSISAGFSHSSISPSSNGYVQFSNTTTGSYPGTTYQLDYGDGNTSSFTNNSFTSWSHSYQSSGSYTVLLTAANSTACISTYSTVITVTVTPCSLSAGFTYTVNSNGMVNFSNTTTGTSGFPTYYWNFGIGSSYAANPAPQYYSSTGQYTVTLTVQDSVTGPCTSTYSQVISITSTSCLINTSFVMLKDSSVTSSIVWDAYPTYPGNTSSVTWSWGDGSTSTGFYPSHTYSSTGAYNICMTVSVSCGASTTICHNTSIYRMSGTNQVASVTVKNTATTGITQLSKNTGLLVYPNPAKDQITVTNSSPGATMIITDLVGKTLLVQVQKDDAAVIDLSGFSPGIYLLKVSDVTGNTTTRIVKE